MTAQKVRTRIAPTPSGFLHIGNLYSFIITWLKAKSTGGTVLLRIDDLDSERMQPEFLEDIFRVLDFIGLVPDEGPSGPEDFLLHHSQVNRTAYYQSFLEQLQQSRLVYACNCSRKEILTQNSDGIYTGICRIKGLSFTAAANAWRLKIPSGPPVWFYDNFRKEKVKVDLQKEMGDFVIRRKGGNPAYQVASLADDIYYNINLVVRGVDLISSTASQLKLAEMLNLEKFSMITWLHHPLLVNRNGEKLSKSNGDTSIKWMIEHGASRTDILTNIGMSVFGREIAVSSLFELVEMYKSLEIVKGS